MDRSAQSPRHHLSFTISNHGVYFAEVRSKPSRLMPALVFHDFAAGRRTVLLEPGTRMGFGLAISPGERSLLYAQVDDLSGDIMMLEGFR